MIVRSGPWTTEQITGFLRDAVIPIRLASSGTYPLVQSLWFLHEDSALWMATQTDSVLAQRLRRDERVGFEVSADSPPYRGVRGTGHASIVDDGAAHLLPRLIDRYLGDAPSSLGSWLMSRLDSEIVVRVDQLAVSSWDYSPRM